MNAQQITRSTSRQWFFSSGSNGIRAICPVAFACSNSGVSCRLRRMKNATTTTTALSQNGTRHPHENLISSGRATTGMKIRAARI